MDKKIIEELKNKIATRKLFDIFNKIREVTENEEKKF